jgi:hypothetical protein
MRRPSEQVNMSVDLWDRTFKRSFFDIRQEIKEIALANFATVENAEILNGTEATTPANLEEGFYIFTDDDDWLHPRISKLLSNVDNSQQTSGVVWGSVAFGTQNRMIITRRNANGFCYTNNYAITGKYLKKDPEHYYAVFQHGGANKALEQHSAKIIEAYWSVTNKNPTSTVYMERVLKGNFSSQLLIGAVEDYLQRCEHIDAEIDSSLQWARPLMYEMVRIFSGLL